MWLRLRITEELNLQLLIEFTTEEINMMISQLNPLKALRLDDFAAYFYQKY
jgi:hypothetical protein